MDQYNSKQTRRTPGQHRDSLSESPPSYSETQKKRTPRISPIEKSTTSDTTPDRHYNKLKAKASDKETPIAETHADLRIEIVNLEQDLRARESVATRITAIQNKDSAQQSDDSVLGTMCRKVANLEAVLLVKEQKVKSQAGEIYEFHECRTAISQAKDNMISALKQQVKELEEDRLAEHARTAEYTWKIESTLRSRDQKILVLSVVKQRFSSGRVYSRTATMASPRPIPFSEPPYLSGIPSPYYSDSHLSWQKRCREFISKNLTSHAMEWETAETVPEHVFHDFSAANMLLPSLPAPLPVERLKSLGIKDILGLLVEEFDYFHNAIYTDEMLKSGLAGPSGSLTTGMAFGVPPLYKFGSKELQDRFLPDLLTGRKRACIAITEPDAGSDVANIQTTAVKSKDGKTYTINGTKKWITNGIWSELSCMAVRTGGPGPGGLSLMVVPLKGHEGVSMRRLKVSGQISAGTTYIELDDVVVPAENLIGEEGMGMKYIMTNFNHERLTIAIGCARQARVALGAAFEYCMKREAFGKSLMDQPVVRHRLAKCGAQLEAQWTWTESFVYAMTKLPKKDADVELGGLTAAAKAQAGVVLMECAQAAVLLFGGNGYTRSGQGEIAEKMWREVPGNRIPGGSEDVMFDLSVRQLVKNYQNKTKMLERPRGSSKL
ncbi:hypothetical protein E4T42_03880 [Aureobasidium subglaciale]|nr:hypothetical protein E4T42_03880 [Aureobasidium subglaciale]